MKVCFVNTVNMSPSQDAQQLSPKQMAYVKVLGALANTEDRMEACISLLTLIEKERGLKNIAPCEFCAWLADVLQNPAFVVVDEETGLATFECLQFSKKHFRMPSIQ